MFVAPSSGIKMLLSHTHTYTKTLKSWLLFPNHKAHKQQTRTLQLFTQFKKTATHTVRDITTSSVFELHWPNSSFTPNRRSHTLILFGSERLKQLHSLLGWKAFFQTLEAKNKYRKYVVKEKIIALNLYLDDCNPSVWGKSLKTVVYTVWRQRMKVFVFINWQKSYLGSHSSDLSGEVWFLCFLQKSSITCVCHSVIWKSPRAENMKGIIHYSMRSMLICSLWSEPVCFHLLFYFV